MASEKAGLRMLTTLLLELADMGGHQANQHYCQKK
jgi:hypothetical protein